MAACTKFLILLSLSLAILLLPFHSATSSPSSFQNISGGEEGGGKYLNHNQDNNDDEDEDDSLYILDVPFNETTTSSRLRSSRFLANVIIKKGTRCATYSKTNVCNGVKANKGTGLLYCCKNHCRNVLGDWNHCGGCGHRCMMNEKCCNGRCVDVLFNRYHCGRCNRICLSFETCENGLCGYD